MQEKLTYISQTGKSISFGNDAPTTLLRYDGLASAPASNQTIKTAHQDGVTFIESTLEPRDVTLEVLLRADDQPGLFDLRENVLRVLNPKNGPGVLRYEGDGISFEAEATLDALPTFPSGADNKGEYWQLVLITFFVPVPFWNAITEKEGDLSFLAGGLEWPLKLAASFAWRGNALPLENNGQVSTPIDVKFYGPGNAPKIINMTTGDFIKVNQEIGENEVLHIVTAFGKKKVEITRADGTVEQAFGYIDLASTFWQLMPGRNIVSYVSDNDSEITRAIITYKERYIGI